MSTVDELAGDLTGKLILSVKMEIESGKADFVQPYLLALRDHANSEEEPGTLTYRVSRRDQTFGLLEEYADKEAWNKHMTYPPWLDFVKHAQQFVKVTVDVYQEL